MRDLLFTLSTGRVGTMCLSKVLAASPEIESYHENHPTICPHSRMRAMQGFYSSPCPCPETHRTHPLEAPHRRPLIEQAHSQGLIYSETAWGIMAWARRFPANSRYIHLIRDPRTWVPSWIAEGIPCHRHHGANVCPPGHPLYRIYWKRWSPAQRSLWWWSEVNRWASAFAETHDVFVLRHEDLILGRASSLFEWLDVEHDAEAVAEAVKTKWNDRGRRKPSWEASWDQGLDHELMEAHGYA